MRQPVNGARLAQCLEEQLPVLIATRKSLPDDPPRVMT
jgi:hypothetical protein